MDILGLIYINDWLLLFIGIFIGLYFFLTWNFKVWESQGVPGPKPIPFFGTTRIFLKKGTFADGDLFEKYGKVVGLFEARNPALLVADPEFIKHILVKDFHSIARRRPGETGTFMDLNLFNASGDHWKMLRHTMSPTFSTGKIKAMMKQLNECSKLLVENIEKEVKAGNDFDMRSYTGSYTMDAIARVAFGLNVESQKDKNNKFVTTINKVFDTIADGVSPMLFLLVFFPKLGRLFAKLGIGFFTQEFNDFFSSVVTQTLEMRESETTERRDFLNLLKNAHKNAQTSKADKSEEALAMDYEKRPLTLDEIKAQGALFFLAGYDTTANALCWLIYSLACNPEIQEKVYDEIQRVIGDEEKPEYDKFNQLEYLDLCIHETLRLYPSVARFDRQVTEDVTIKGVHIPKGAILLLSPLMMHRIPEYFPEPEKFKPERFTEKHMGYLDTYYYLPFGGGPRTCIGMRLALIEMKLAAVHLLQKFKFKTSSKTVIPPNLRMGFNMREKDGTWLQAEVRS